MTDTKYGDMIEDHEWTEPPEPGDEGHPVEVGHHMLTIKDERESIETYDGFQWSFLIDDGTITAVDQSHYCPGPSHVDPMAFVAWGDVPEAVQRVALREMNGAVEEVVDVEATEGSVR